MMKNCDTRREHQRINKDANCHDSIAPEDKMVRPVFHGDWFDLRFDTH